MTELIIIVLLILGGGLFAGAEIAILSVRKTKLHDLLRRRESRALAVQSLREHPERFLATVQIGITVVSATSAAFGGASIAGILASWLTSLGVGESAEEIAFAMVIAFVSWLSLVLGELVPKSLALRYSDRYSFLVARPLLGLSYLMRPLVWFLTVCSNVILRFFGDSTNFTEGRMSRDELQQLVEEAAKTGSLDPQESEIASRALGFGEVAAAEIMVPRHRIIALRKDTDGSEMEKVILDKGHQRMPIYEDTIDHIIGYVVSIDVLAQLRQEGRVVLDDILRPAYIVSENSRAVDLLKEMQRRRLQMAVVTDEHGGIAGLITIEDLVEELVGDIFSEDEVPNTEIVREAAGTTLVQGHVPVRKVNRELDLELPVGADRATMAGLCIALAEAIPQAGQKFTIEDGTVLEVVDASPRRVRKVRIHPPRLDPDAEPGAEAGAEPGAS